MRWAIYNRAEERFDAYDAVLDEGIIELAARFGSLISLSDVRASDQESERPTTGRLSQDAVAEIQSRGGKVRPLRTLLGRR